MKYQRPGKESQGSTYKGEALPVQQIDDIPYPNLNKGRPVVIGREPDQIDSARVGIRETNKPQRAPDYIALDGSDGDDFIDTYEMIQRNSNRPLCQEQIELVKLKLSGKNVFYTRSAGCGKSTELNCFRCCLRDLGKSIVAPTGRAALDINGQTFYTYARWTPNSFKYSIKELEERAQKRLVRKRLQKADVLVIDEISMIEYHHFERSNRIMQTIKRDSFDHFDKAFEGVQIVVKKTSVTSLLFYSFSTTLHAVYAL